MQLRCMDCFLLSTHLSVPKKQWLKKVYKQEDIGKWRCESPKTHCTWIESSPFVLYALPSETDHGHSKGRNRVNPRWRTVGVWSRFVAEIRVAVATFRIPAVVLLVVATLFPQPLAVPLKGAVFRLRSWYSLPAHDVAGVSQLDFGDCLEAGHAASPVPVFFTQVCPALEVRVARVAADGVCILNHKKQDSGHSNERH